MAETLADREQAERHAERDRLLLKYKADRDRLAARVKELEETVRQLQSAFAKQAAREWSGAGRCNWLTR